MKNNKTVRYFVADLELEDIKDISVEYPKGTELCAEDYSIAVDILDCFFDEIERYGAPQRGDGAHIELEELAEFLYTEGVKITINL